MGNATEWNQCWFAFCTRKDFDGDVVLIVDFYMVGPQSNLEDLWQTNSATLTLVFLG